MACIRTSLVLAAYSTSCISYLTLVTGTARRSSPKPISPNQCSMTTEYAQVMCWESTLIIVIQAIYILLNNSNIYCDIYYLISPFCSTCYQVQVTPYIDYVPPSSSSTRIFLFDSLFLTLAKCWKGYIA